MMWITRSYYLLGLILVGIFGIWLVVQVTQDDVIQRKLDPDTPEAYATHLVLSELDNQGNVKSRYYADKAIRYPNNITDLTVPRAILYNTTDDGVSDTLDIGGMLAVNGNSQTHHTKPPWVINAEHGQLREGGDVLFLWGNVHISQAKSNTNLGTVLVTSELTYYPKTRLADTAKPVEIKQSNSNQVNAVGMKANLNTGEITFLSQMRGRYELQ